MVGEVGKAGKWIHRVQLARAIVDCRVAIQRIWAMKLLLRYAEEVGVGMGVGETGEGGKGGEEDEGDGFLHR